MSSARNSPSAQTSELSATGAGLPGGTDLGQPRRYNVGRNQELAKIINRAKGAIVPLAVLLITCGLAVGASAHGTHAHHGFPPVPNGLNQIINTFGQPCNATANDNYTMYSQGDPGLDQAYRVNYHKELGGAGGANVISGLRHHAWDEGSEPSNVDDGWFGYNCRKMAGTDKWSTHAWGIAVDGNTVPEHQWNRHCHYHFWTNAHRTIWKDHGFTDGVTFCDPGHFQYATGY